ncbi:MAG: helix-turn-helix domain-containing protein [Candidatus Sericytochromatia bacterium]|nr:helix-turn-helix domain-containing protein [Candidatus Sericytochromatia bacterium]
MPRRSRRKFTLAEKALLVGEIEHQLRAGVGSVRSIAASLAIADASYHSWVKAGIRPPGTQQPVEGRHPTHGEREALVARVQRLAASGQTFRQACQAVGITEKSFQRWRERYAPPPAMRPVEVTALVPLGSTALAGPMPPPAPTSLTLQAPGGYSISGLDVASAAALLRALTC